MPKNSAFDDYILPLTVLAFVFSFAIPYLWVVFLLLMLLAVGGWLAGLLGLR